jgi:hypothetical protein
VSHWTPEKSENARKRENDAFSWYKLGLVQDKMVENGRNWYKMEESAG